MSIARYLLILYNINTKTYQEVFTMADSWKAPSQRKWTASKIEQEFEKLLTDNGFMIIGIKEHQTLTDYKAGKDGIFQDYRLYHNGTISAKDHFNGFMRFWDIRVQYDQLKAQYEQDSNLY